jgi:MoaA/NifB/PqqE/SkfB family radical SAM enzyme
LAWDHLTREDKEAILKGIEDGVAYGGPYHVEFHPQDRCNVDCFFCSTASMRAKDEIPMPRFEEILAELKEMGTKAIRLSGGGEPLFHRNIRDFLALVKASGLPIENLTTNGVLLRPDIAELLVGTCEQVTVSLNTADETTYASMMQTNVRNFQRVVDNMSGLVKAKRARGTRNPHVKLQFLVWKENYKSIPDMYRLACEAGVDSILFNGLAYLRPDQQMNEAETEEMMGLYEGVLRIDEYRKIDAINSFEQDISQRVARIGVKVGTARNEMNPIQRMAHLLLRDDFSLGEKVEHVRKRRERERVLKANAGLASHCVIGWHSMLVRATGVVAPCCILQGKELGNVYKQSIREVWHGEAFNRFRSELSRVLREGASWEYDPERDKTVEAICGPHGNCPIANFYYYPDTRFVRSFNDTLGKLTPPAAAEPRQSTPASP